MSGELFIHLIKMAPYVTSDPPFQVKLYETTNSLFQTSQVAHKKCLKTFNIIYRFQYVCYINQFYGKFLHNLNRNKDTSVASFQRHDLQFKYCR